jgi:hypothetical protein
LKINKNVKKKRGWKVEKCCQNILSCFAKLCGEVEQENVIIAKGRFGVQE